MMAMNPEQNLAIQRFTKWNNLHGSKARTEIRQHVWKRRSRHWQGGTFGRDWKPVKVVGQGAFGIVGLFDYIGDQPNHPAHIVVKQSAGSSRTDLAEESKFLQRLSSTGSKHFLHVYASYCSEAGTGSHPTFDPPPGNDPYIINGKLAAFPQQGAPAGTYDFEGYEPNWPEVSRIYMEYCDGGDAYRLRWTRQPQVPTEAFMWRMWECLAKALVVLEQGSEDRKVRGWKSIIHFDLKPLNVLIKLHTPQDNCDHDIAADVYKLADFGFARYCPGSGMEKNKKWIAHTAQRGTDGFKAPEQDLVNHPNRKIGTAVNVWGIACIMYNMFFPDPSEGPPRTVYKAQCRLRSRAWLNTLAGELIVQSPHCSETFRKLMLRCLALNPVDRPTPTALLREIDNALQIINQPNEPKNLGQPQVTNWVTLDQRYVNEPLLPMIPVSPLMGSFDYKKLPEDPGAIDELNIIGAQPLPGGYQGIPGRNRWVPLPDWPDEDNEAGSVILQVLIAEQNQAQAAAAAPAAPLAPPLVYPAGLQVPPHPWVNTDWEY